MTNETVFLLGGRSSPRGYKVFYISEHVEGALPVALAICPQLGGAQRVADALAQAEGGRVELLPDSLVIPDLEPIENVIKGDAEAVDSEKEQDEETATGVESPGEEGIPDATPDISQHGQSPAENEKESAE